MSVHVPQAGQPWIGGMSLVSRDSQHSKHKSIQILSQLLLWGGLDTWGSFGLVWAATVSGLWVGVQFAISHARHLKVRTLPLLCSVALVVLGTDFLRWRSWCRRSLVVTLGFIRAKKLLWWPLGSLTFTNWGICLSNSGHQEDPLRDFYQRLCPFYLPIPCWGFWGSLTHIFTFKIFFTFYLFFYFFWGMISYSPDWLSTSYKAKGDFGLVIVLPPFPECWC